MPQYSLEKIVDAARDKKIIYGGKGLSQSIANLEYTLDNVAECISQLNANNHRKIWTSDDGSAIFDVYVANYSPSEDHVDRIYMKLRLVNENVYVSIGSFKLE